MKVKYKGPYSPAEINLPNNERLLAISGKVYELPEKVVQSLTNQAASWWETNEEFVVEEGGKTPKSVPVSSYATEEWTTNHLYPSGMVVKCLGVSYLALKQSENVEPGTEANSWGPIGGGMAEWAPFTYYEKGTLVMHEGEILRAIHNFTSGASYEF
jgi:hypothetical protein